MKKILHILPHFGGGVGKSLSSLLDKKNTINNDHYIYLLEDPIEKKYLKKIDKKKIINKKKYSLNYLVEKFDIIQIEFWNHPKLIEFLVNSSPMKARIILWSHISNNSYLKNKTYSKNNNLFFVNSSNLEPENSNSNFFNITSGFCDGLHNMGYYPWNKRKSFFYAGALDYRKIDKPITQIISYILKTNNSFNLYGDGKDRSKVLSSIENNSDEFTYHGHVDNLYEEMKKFKFLIYPLTKDNYATGENVLIESMALGCVPLVFNNDLEKTIIPDIAHDLLAKDLNSFLRNIDKTCRKDYQNYSLLLRKKILNDHLSKTAYDKFDNLYNKIMSNNKLDIDFTHFFGKNPIDWYLNTNTLSRHNFYGSKGDLLHFFKYFNYDDDLSKMYKKEIYKYEVSNES